MKVKVLQSNLLKAINQVSRVVGARTTLPVLSNVLITASKGKIELSATDLEIGIVTSTIGKIEAEGEVTLPAKLLVDFIANNKDESIDLSVEGVKAVLSSSHYQADIVGISADEFPKIPLISSKEEIELPCDRLLASLKKVAIAPANDETRPVLAGVYFQFAGKELTLAATDSFRLSECNLALGKEVEEKKIIIPARTINEVIRLASSNDAKSVLITLTDNQVAIKIGETQIVSRLIEGVFPNYKQIIPTESKVKIVADYGELLSGIKMSSLFAKDNANNNIKIKTGTGEMVISSALMQTGKAKSQIPAEIEGGEIEVSFNARYILDVLQVINAKKVLILLNDSTSAGVIKTEDDPGFIYIIMPLKLDV